MAMPFLEPPSVDHITVPNKLIMRDALPVIKRLYLLVFQIILL